MKIHIWNLHSLCENNTIFLSRAWRYFQLNGHDIVDESGDADLVFIGGCAVTDLMCSRCKESILESMQRHKHSQFVVFGCLAAFPAAMRSLSDKYNDRLHVIPYESSCRVDELIQARIPFDCVSVNRLKGHVPYQPQIGPDDCYVLIAQGCVNNCSYCNIKKVKGTVASRREEDIEDEVRSLYGSGVRTVTLLSDDCGSYGLERGSDLASLLIRLSRIAPDLKYKLYTVFPSLFLKFAGQMESLFEQHRVPYVCLPVQSASRRILHLMNRRYDPDQLSEAIQRLRTLDSGIFIYSHFIFNFPTETWEEFEQSVAFARHFDNCVFIGYGENSETEAAAIFPKCDNKMLQAKTERLGKLIKQGEISAFVVPNP